MDAAEGRTRALGRRGLSQTTAGTLALLCRGRRTVAELAAHLGVSDNAVRAQLQRLLRDGLVRRAGARRGVRRPHAEYEITPRARALFPKAYEPVLRTLVDVIGEHLPQRAARNLLFQAGRRLVAAHLVKPSVGSARRRIALSLSKLNGSGLGIELVEGPGKTTVRSCSCPLSSLVTGHPELCDVLARVLADALGVEVRQRCERGDAPRCCFELSPGSQ
jgi:predicted ArsR family transcriptional regulator